MLEQLSLFPTPKPKPNPPPAQYFSPPPKEDPKPAPARVYWWEKDSKEPILGRYEDSN